MNLPGIAAGGDGGADLLGEVLEALSEGIALFDAEARLIRCNSRMKAFNPGIADIIAPGTPWEILVRAMHQRGTIPESARSRLMWMEARLAEGHPGVPELEVAMPGGQVHLFSMRQTPQGGFVVTQADITARRQYEEDERQADLLLRMVLEACPANVVMSRVGDGHILYRSPAATELLGTTRNAGEHFASREQRADFITALLPDGRVDDMQVTGLRPDGTPFPCSVSARLIDYRGEDVVVSSTIDLSREVEMQRTLAEQREQIFQAEKLSALGELLAGVAHELNNPLSVVVGHALMLREEVTEPDLARRIERISDAAERCGRIVKSFLAMARQQPLRLAPVALSDVVGTGIEALRQGAAGMSTRVALDLPGDLPPVSGDADQLAQVIQNLVTNADQAIVTSGKGDLIRVSASADPTRGTVTLRVEDNGPGIPKEIRGRIFDPLFTTKELGKGTGIGLAFVHRVVTSHGGRIRLEKGDGGAAFRLTLPIHQGAPEASETEDDETVGAGPARILIVDDEPDVAELIAEILLRDGYRVDRAGSGEAALDLMRQQRYALVLTDLNMPGMGGKGLYEVLRREAPGLAARMGFVSGDTMSPAMRGFLDSAGLPFLEKPIAPGELRGLVRRILEGARI